jgi:MFS family permease
MASAEILAAMPMQRADQLSLRSRVIAYAAILGGYFYYCYNWLLTDYVRPYLMSNYAMSLDDTAILSVTQNVGVTIGSLVAATVLARIGRRWGAVIIALATGALTGVNLLAIDLTSWIGLRGAISLFLGGYYVAANSLMVSLFPPQYRARLAALNSGMFSMAEIALGGIGAAAGDQGWRLLLWFGAVPPVILGILMLWVVPDDRRVLGYGEEGGTADAARRIGTWGEMLSGPWRRYTLTCLVLAGLNFTGYQLFSSFVTVYLKQVRGFDAQDMGAIVALIGAGSLTGGFFWAWIADRFGRRMNLFGFVGIGAFIVLFLIAPHDKVLLSTLGFLYGVCLSCTYPWGVYFTEIFPSHLRPYGAALFHGGHIISLSAPLLVSWAAGRWGLVIGMGLAPIVFVCGALLWSTLPETLRSARGYRGHQPG